MSGDLACTYAALILSDDGQEVTAEKMDTIIKAAGVTIEPYWSMLFGKFVATKSVDELIANVGAGGGGGGGGRLIDAARASVLSRVRRTERSALKYQLQSEMKHFCTTRASCPSGYTTPRAVIPACLLGTLPRDSPRWKEIARRNHRRGHVNVI